MCKQNTLILVRSILAFSGEALSIFEMKALVNLTLAFCKLMPVN